MTKKEKEDYQKLKSLLASLNPSPLIIMRYDTTYTNLNYYI